MVYVAFYRGSQEFEDMVVSSLIGSCAMNGNTIGCLRSLPDPGESDLGSHRLRLFARLFRLAQPLQKWTVTTDQVNRLGRNAL